MREEEEGAGRDITSSVIILAQLLCCAAKLKLCLGQWMGLLLVAWDTPPLLWQYVLLVLSLAVLSRAARWVSAVKSGVVQHAP
jgi:hypothetical protein